MRHKQYLLSLYLCSVVAANAQSWQWAKEANSSVDELVWDVACDTTSGAVVAGGYFKGNISAAYGSPFSATNGGGDGFVAKYNAAGTLLWAFKAGGSSDDEVRSVASDASGNVYVTGYFNGTVDFDPTAGTFNLASSGAKNGFLAKYTTSGTLIWAVRFACTTNCESWKVCCDPAGNAYVTGQYDNAVTFTSTSGATASTSSTAGQIEVFACKYNASGVIQWAISGGSSKDDIGYDIVADNNNVYLTGVFCNSFTLLSTSGSSVASLNAASGNKSDVFVFAFTQSGSFLWATSAGSNEDDTAAGIAQDATHIYITGTIKDDANFPHPSPSIVRNCQGATDIFLASLSKTSGTFQWVSTQTGSGTGDEEASAVDVNSDGTILVTGYFRNTLTYTPFGLTNLGPASAKDVFLAGFDISGNILWAKSAGGPGDDVGYGLTHDMLHNVYIGGEHKDAAVFGANTLTNAGAKNIFVAKYGCAPISNNTISTPQTICSGSTPASLAGTAPTGGSSPYTYLWRQSADNINWSNAPGTNNAAGYSPPSLSANTYYQRLVSSTGYCIDNAASTSLLISITQPPTPSSAGSDQAICSSSSVLNGNNPTVGTGTWFLLSGSGNITNPNTFNSAVTSLGVGTNKFIWRISNGTCPPSRDTVSIVRSTNPSTANAGNNQTICSSSAFLNAVNPFTGTGSWQVHSGSGTITDPSNDNTTVTGLSTGINQFVWTVTNGSCPPSIDSVTVTVDEYPTAANAGNDRGVCSSTDTLNGNVPTVGTGSWSVLSGLGSILNLGVFNSVVNSLSIGSNQFIWTISNGTCPSSKDTVTITRNANPSTAYAGNDQTICNSNAFINAINPAIGNGNWQVSSGSGTITDPSDDNTTITGLSTGSNVFVWTVTNGVCPPSLDTVVITVDAQPTASSAGNDQVICASTAVISANAPAVGTGNWSVFAGAATVTSPGTNTTNVNGLGTGSNNFIWTISNGVCPPSRDTVRVFVDAMPSAANAGVDQDICDQANFQLQATIPTTGAGNWQVLGGSATIASPVQPHATASNLVAGDNLFSWTVSNGVCPSSADTVIIHMDEAPTASNAGSDQSVCINIFPSLNANVPVVGTGLWNVVSGAVSITDPTLAGTALSSLVPGTTVFAWTIANGVCPSSSDTVSIHIDALPDPAIAGTDQSVCGAAAVLSATAISTGTASWSLNSGSGNIGNASSPGSPVNNLGAGSNVFVWTVANGVCPASIDTVLIHSDEPPSIALAGNDVLRCGDTIQLAGNAPQTGTGEWTLLTGSCVFSDLHAATAEVSDFPAGPNTFVWTISNGVCTASTDTVLIQSDARPDVALAENDKKVCTASAPIAANSPVTGTGTWILLSGAANIADTTVATTLINDLDIGLTILRWKISNGICPASYDDIIITRDAFPDTAHAGSDISSDIPEVQLSANTPVTGSGSWIIVAGKGVFENVNDPLTRVRDLGTGTNIFKWSIHNGVCPANTDEIIITLNPLKIPNGFSPNDDGVNDAFIIPSLEYYPNIHMSIFNRWGNVVYENEHYKNDWNGKNTNDQPLSDDTYYYVLEVRPGESYNGFVILKTNK